ncbi:MAG: insulinase family protein [Gemmatimonadetes bacterium]|nr:insulinase family protein [Gemmatimonadota bacterium]
MSEHYRRSRLEGGLEVLTEWMPGLRSASLGIWVRAGSLSEAPADMGISHLLEHMVFKGTKRRTAREIAIVLERVGGSLDAYTTREHTSFQARVLDEHVDLALDVLGDLVLDPLLREEDLELEREVVLEEIATVEDTPDDLVFDLHADRLWQGHPYGYSILGNPQTVSGFRAADLRRAHDALYHPGNMVVAAAGNVDHERLVDQIGKLFAGRGARGERPVLPTPPDAPGEARAERLARSTAQTHLVWGVRTFGHRDPRRYALVLLSSAFGGGMSSRLFQRVREELGLAYTVYSYQTFYHDAGIVGVYVGTRPESADKAESVVNDELARIAKDGLSAEELGDAKGQLKGQIALSLESSSARLHRLAGVALNDEPYCSLEEVVDRVERVSGEAVAALAQCYYDPARQTLLTLGPRNDSNA